MDKLEDVELVGLEVTFESVHQRTLIGARNAFGVSEEPDEEVYTYEVVKVSIYDVDIDLNKMPLSSFYKEEDDMMADVSEKVLDLLKDKLG